MRQLPLKFLFCTKDIPHTVGGALSGAWGAWVLAPQSEIIIGGAAAGALLARWTLGWPIMFASLVGGMTGSMVHALAEGLVFGACVGLCAGLWMRSRKDPAITVQRRLLFVIGTALAHLATACQERQEADVAACARCLPYGLTLSTEFYSAPEDRLNRSRQTLRQALADAGAYCKNGHIFDRWKQELCFIWISSCVAPYCQDAHTGVGVEANTYERLRRRYRVVVMYAS